MGLGFMTLGLEFRAIVTSVLRIANYSLQKTLQQKSHGANALNFAWITF